MKFKFVVIALGVLCLARTGLGQTTFGTILGIVTDPTGAVVPNVQITVTNQDENISRETRSDSQGNYQMENLKEGLYTVKSHMAGFREFSVTNLRLLARQTLRADVRLEVGATQQEVTVQAAAPLITTDSQTIAAHFSTQEVLALPANYRGAGSTSPYSLLAFLPGVQSDDDKNFSVQGGLPFQVEYTVDGVSTLSIRYNGPLTEMFPSADAISEMRVQGVGNRAEYGQVGDITTTTKAGANALHGSAFEYLQNRALDATPFGSVTKPPKAANTFGAAVGGPIRKNRTFFFADYEGMRYRTGATFVDTVPTEAMRRGDFSKEPFVLTDLTGKPLPNNSLDASKISPVAQKILQFYPLPNFGPTDVLTFGNRRVNKASPTISDQFDVRIDHTINTKQSVFGRFTWKHINFTSPQVLLIPTETDFEKGNQLVVSHNYIFTPALLNEFRFGFTRDFQGGNFPFDGPKFMDDLGLKGIGPFPPGGLPDFEFYGSSGVTYFGHSRPNILHSENTQLNENLTWTKGRHTMKFGFDYRHIRMTNVWYDTFGDDYGDYFFQDQFTGFDFADFLQGVPAFTEIIHTAPLIDGRTSHYRAYAQDVFKVNPRLTLEFGLRYERMPPFIDPVNHTNFDRSVPITGRVVISSDPKSKAITNPFFLTAINACPAPPINGVPCTPFLTAKEAGWPEGLRKTYNNFNPRLGFAYRPFGGTGTVIRGGAGLYTVTTLGRVFYSVAGVHTGYAATFFNNLVSGQPVFQFPDTQFGNPAESGQQVGTQDFRTGNQFDKRDPYTIQWNLTAEHTLWNNTDLRLSYIGTRGVWLTWAPDINQPFPSTTPYSQRPLTDRPFPNWNLLYSRDGGANSIYHSMQVEFTHKYSGGLTLDSTWTWAHNLSDVSSSSGSGFAAENGQGRTMNFHDRRADRGNTGGTRRHRWVTTMIYNVPVGKGHRFLSNASGVLGGVVGGWRLSSIALLETGPFLTPLMSGGDPSGTGAPGRSSQRPDAVGNGNISNPTADHWWDRSAFVCPGKTPADPNPFKCNVAPIGRFGSAGVGTLVGPGSINLSLGLAKDFRITERARLRFESSFTNFPNHPNLADPNSRNISSGSFGRIFSARGADSGGNRIGQFALRIEF